MCIRIPWCCYNFYIPLFTTREKYMWLWWRKHGIRCNLHTSIRTILETNRTRKSGCKFPMSLGFCSPRTDSPPTDEIREIQGGKWIEKFCRRRNSYICNIKKKLPCYSKSFFNHISSIQMRIINESLPSYSRSRFLEICAHHNLQSLSKFLSPLLNISSIFDCWLCIMNRTWPNNNQDPIIFSMDYRRNSISPHLYISHLFRNNWQFSSK